MPAMLVGTGRSLLNRATPAVLDGVANISWAFSVRRLRSAYVGPCLRVRRSTDNAERDFGFDSRGTLNAPEIIGWLAGATGFVRTWYDQSGNGRHAEQATTTRQPQFEANAQNGRPALFYQNATLALITPSFPHFPSKRGGVNVVLRTTAEIAYALSTFSQTSPSWILYVTTSGTNNKWYDGGVNRTASSYDAVGVVQQHTLVRTSDTTVAYRRNGQLLATPSGINNNQPATNPLYIGATTLLVTGLVGDYFETVGFSATPTTAELTTFEVSQRSYYGLA